MSTYDLQEHLHNGGRLQPTITPETGGRELLGHHKAPDEEERPDRLRWPLVKRPRGGAGAHGGQHRGAAGEDQGVLEG